MKEGKETKGKLMMETKRQRTNAIDTEEERDRLSELPDCVLLHIMEFMDTKHAVQTSVLSKRWKNLWKPLTCLSFGGKYFGSIADFSNFVFWVLSSLEGSISMINLDLWACGWLSPTITKHEVLRNIRALTMTVIFISDRFLPLMSSCRSLTFLKLSAFSFLPKSLHLPSLKSLHLDNVGFTASDNDLAEPFSACNSLNTLVIGDFVMTIGAKVLCISNSNLSSLTLGNTLLDAAHRIVLSTPNLGSLNVICGPIPEYSASDLSFLEQVNIDTHFRTHFEESRLALISLLQALADYVKILILSSSTLEILNGLSTSDSMITQIPCFLQLKSLKLKMESLSNISDEGVSRIVEYLLKKSPEAKVDVINC